MPLFSCCSSSSSVDRFHTPSPITSNPQKVEIRGDDGVSYTLFATAASFFYDSTLSLEKHLLLDHATTQYGKTSPKPLLLTLAFDESYQGTLPNHSITQYRHLETASGTVEIFRLQKWINTEGSRSPREHLTSSYTYQLRLIQKTASELYDSLSLSESEKQIPDYEDLSLPEAEEIVRKWGSSPVLQKLKRQTSFLERLKHWLQK